MRAIRNIINNNFTGEPNELFITLTYAFDAGQPMNDVKKASRDFDNFIKRFRRRYSDLQYIAILEPQANTAWHWHLLVKFTDWNNPEQFYIDNNAIIEPLWGHGWTRTQKIDNVDNIGAYLCGYLANVEINDENRDEIFEKVYKNARDIIIEEKEVTDADGKKHTKKFIKSGRLHLYQSGTNIFRRSKGIVKPVSELMSYKQAKTITGRRNPDFSKSISIAYDFEDGQLLNVVTYEHYNLKRKKNKLPEIVEPAPADLEIALTAFGITGITNIEPINYEKIQKWSPDEVLKNFGKKGG
jgi:hypothetical protein